ncbi:MAG: hypothetical protein J6N21_17795 [Butyrivibrio sp.]|nr:hypothetical protein [Butyrivibrio sp.]
MGFDNIDIKGTLDSFVEGTKETAEIAHQKTSAFHENYISKVTPDLGKYGDAARFVAEMAPGVSEYNAIREGDWQGFAISAGIDIAAVAAGAFSFGSGYAAVKGTSTVAKVGVKVATKEIAEAGAKKVVKEVAEAGAKKAVKEVAEAGAEKAVKEVVETGAEKVVKEVAENGTKAVAKEIAETGTQKAAKEVASKVTEKTVKEVVETGVEKTAKEATEAGIEKVAKETVEEGLEKAAKEVAETATEKAAKEVTEEGAEKATKEVAEAATEKVAKEAGEAGAEKTVKEVAEDGTEKAVKEAAEEGSKKIAKEAAEEASETATKEVKENVDQVVKNKLDGLAREEKVFLELSEKYADDVADVIPEAYLRDANGNIIKDAITGEARRIDYVVSDGKKVIESIEVTSETADKALQTAKELRILEQAKKMGGAFIRDDKGNLIEFGVDVVTEIRRLP